MKESEIVEIVEAGNRTASEIADAADKHPSHMSRVLKDMATEDKAEAVRDGALFREKDGRSWVYSAPTELDADPSTAPAENEGEQVGTVSADASPGSFTVEAESGDGLMPVNRDYDFDAEVPEDTREYRQYDGELDRINALVETRKFSGVLPHFLVDGPTGCGKTTLAQQVASEHDAAYFELQMSNSTKESDLIGSPTIIGGQTVWVDGPIVKALLASRERPVVLCVDEANRAKPKAKGALFSVLDDRARVALNGGRGGEVIEGDSENLIVIATINEGDEYHGTHSLDAAEKRRYGNRLSVDYLGYGVNSDGSFDMDKRDAEADLVAEHTPVDIGLAELLVDAANEIRKAGKDDTNTNVPMGVPTDALLRWAGTAYAFDAAGIENPVMAAAEETVVNAYYDGNSVSEVRNKITPIVDGAPVSTEEFVEWAAGEKAVCDDCGHSEAWESYQEKGVAVYDECPECGETIRHVNATDN